VYKHPKLVTLYFNTNMVQIFVSALHVVCCFSTVDCVVFIVAEL